MSESISIKITPPSVEVPTRKAVVFLNRKLRRAKKFKKNHFVLCTLLPTVFILAGQLYLCPSLSIGAPTDLDKFPVKTQKSVCKRICKQGYTLCDDWWNVYRGKSTPGRFVACATKTCVYPLGWVATGFTYAFGGLEPASFVLACTGSIGKAVDEFIGHTKSSDEAACDCPKKGWFSWLMDWLFEDREGPLPTPKGEL